MASDQALIVSDANEAPDILRSRFQEWGYLYFKHYAAASKCEALLSDILSRLSPHVALDESRQLPVLTGDAFVETDAIWDEVYPKIQALESFHGFFHDPHLLQLMRTVSNSEVFVYPMKMLALMLPLAPWRVSGLLCMIFQLRWGASKYCLLRINAVCGKS